MKGKFNSLDNKLKILLLLILVVIIVVIIILLVKLNKDTTDSYTVNSEQEKFREEYESLNDEKTSDDKTYPKVDIGFNNMKYLTIDETLEILNDGTAAIYIGYAECLYCRSAVQVLVDTANDVDLEYIYYLDISEIWDVKELDKDGNIVTKVESHDKYKKLLEELGLERYYIENYILISETGEEIDTKEKRVSVPLVIFVVNGEVVSSRVGTLFSQYDPYKPLNNEQIDELKEIYKSGINDVLEALNNKEIDAS